MHKFLSARWMEYLPAGIVRSPATNSKGTFPVSTAGRLACALAGAAAEIQRHVTPAVSKSSFCMKKLLIAFIGRLRSNFRSRVVQALATAVSRARTLWTAVVGGLYRRS